MIAGAQQGLPDELVAGRRRLAGTHELEGRNRRCRERMRVIACQLLELVRTQVRPQLTW